MYTINMFFLFTLVISKMFIINVNFTIICTYSTTNFSFAVIILLVHKSIKKSEQSQLQLSTLTSISQETFSN